MASEQFLASLNSGVCERKDAIFYLKSSVMQGAKPDPAVLSTILLVALDHFPTRDYALYLSLVPIQLQDSKDYEAVRFLNKLENDLERGRFESFWKLWATRPDTLTVTPNFERNVRASILQVLGDCVIQCAEQALNVALNVKDSKAFIAGAENTSGVKPKIADGIVSFEKNQFNYPEASSTKVEKLTLDRIAAISNYTINK